MSNDLKELRRSAVVTTFGPGAVVDFRAENAPVSGIIAGLEEWDSSFSPAGLQNSQHVREERLEIKLGVGGFRLPPVIEKKYGKPLDKRRLVAVRFPKWLQCPHCNKIGPDNKWAEEPGQAYRYCGPCTNGNPGKHKIYVIPVRFVLACPKGHIEDFPWHWWVNHKDGCKNLKGQLKLKSEASGLAGLKLSCPECSAFRSMDGIFSQQTWQRFDNCSGKRPWLADGDEICDHKPIAVQRGASNLYFPVIESALSIPPWSDGLPELIGDDIWDKLINDEFEKRIDFIENHSTKNIRFVLEDRNLTAKELAELIEHRKKKRKSVEDEINLKFDEYDQLINDTGDQNENDRHFEIRPESVPQSISKWISRVVRVVRLREIRAIKGFTRINPPGNPDDIASLSLLRKNWLPAIEVLGEGIFLALNEKELTKWEKLKSVKNRVNPIINNYSKDWKERHKDNSSPQPEISARYMLCHTLSHILMRELTLECGYSAASLQERIFASDGKRKMSGLLIYTATSDADGTLGGLQRQGFSDRIGEILTRAVNAVEWCSSDPLCITDMMGAEASFSHSICHACSLAPETSCETFNRFLDRALLIGEPDNKEIGFFQELLKK